jgi:acetoin utilization deacetylase AcuC-like enzyme
MEELAMVHRPEYIKRVETFCQEGGGFWDVDTYLSPGSYKAALYAAGGTIEATTAVVNKEVPLAYALVRPPGHHAERDRAMGFCLFNNIAVAARAGLEAHGLKRILIVDWDVHHGNGTQSTFYDDPTILHFDVHQSPFYPGTGGQDETGHAWDHLTQQVETERSNAQYPTPNTQ